MYWILGEAVAMKAETNLAGMGQNVPHEVDAHFWHVAHSTFEKDVT